MKASVIPDETIIFAYRYKGKVGSIMRNIDDELDEEVLDYMFNEFLTGLKKDKVVKLAGK